jgi:hypothetical protein
MVVIRRLVDRHRAYTGIFLPGEPAKIFPTSDQEHSRILQIYKQDRSYEGIVNDFSDYALSAIVHPKNQQPRRSGVAKDPAKQTGNG